MQFKNTYEKFCSQPLDMYVSNAIFIYKEYQKKKKSKERDKDGFTKGKREGFVDQKYCMSSIH